MKRNRIHTAAVLPVLAALLWLTACSNGSADGSSAATADTAATTAAADTAATASAGAVSDKETDLHRLHAPASNSDPFAGSWRITKGTGAQLKSFVFSFDGNKKDSLIIGTTGYCGTYQLEKKDGEDIFSTHLMFGLDGEYTYRFSEDKQTVFLVNSADKTATTMQKDTTYSCVPGAVKDPVVDEALLGAWKDDTGEYLYFGKDGVMYKTQMRISFTFYTYTAKDGAVQATYSTNKEEQESFTYRVSGDKLVFNNYEYRRIPASELV